MGLSKIQKGDSAVLLLTAKLAEAGLAVLCPISEDLPFDLVIFDAGKYYRVQVKRAQLYRGGPRYEVPFRQITVNTKRYKVYRYDETHAEFLIGVVVPTGDCYCFPLAETRNVKASVQVNPGRTRGPRSSQSTVDPEKYRNLITLGGKVIKLEKEIDPDSAEDLGTLASPLVLKTSTSQGVKSSTLLSSSKTPA